MIAILQSVRPAVVRRGTRHTQAGIAVAILIAAILTGPAAPGQQAAQPGEARDFDPARRLWQGIPGLERTAKGRLYVSWFTGGPKEPAPGNTVVLARSDDGGKTFTAPEPLGLPEADGTRCYDPCLWVDPRGRLWYFFNRGNRQTARHSVVARICDDPDATPPVFGPEVRIGFDVPFAFRMNKPTVLSTGEWLLPVTHAATPVPAWSTGYTEKQTPLLHGVAISSDEGRTWRLHGAVAAPPWPLENMIVELNDGRLWMLIRTSSGVLWQSHSSDKGRTWSAGEPSSIKSPGSRFFIRRLASGSLLLVNHHNFTGRSHLTARLSTDDGATWNDGLLLDERAGVSYPDGVQDKDGLVWITYDRDRQGTGDILLATFREEDVAAGRDVSGKVSLKQVLNKLEKSAELAAVIAADDARVAAFKKPTVEALDELFSRDLHYAHSTGVVDTKPSFIDVLTSGKTKYVAVDYEDRDFSFPAPGVALMTGRVRIQAVTPDATLDNLLSFLAVWRLEEGRWRFLAWQSCRLPPPAPR
jgi:predicted neuraminidase